MWLLTEVPHRWELPGYRMTIGSTDMALHKRWAVVASRLTMDEHPSPHPASAIARVEGVTFVSSILPWRGCGDRAPWRGADHAARMVHALEDLAPILRGQEHLVWGGDWNQALSGKEYAGSIEGRQSLLSLVDELALSIPTATLPHRVPDLLAIDHIAVSGAATSVIRVVAIEGQKRLSDHDMYVIEM